MLKAMEKNPAEREQELLRRGTGFARERHRPEGGQPGCSGAPEKRPWRRAERWRGARLGRPPGHLGSVMPPWCGRSWKGAGADVGAWFPYKAALAAVVGVLPRD